MDKDDTAFLGLVALILLLAVWLCSESWRVETELRSLRLAVNQYLATAESKAP